MKILVTGAAGFIGSHLCERLVNDHQVVGLDNFCDFYDIKIKRKNVAKLSKNENFQLIKADIRKLDELEDIFALHDFDLVIHLAAMAGVRPSIENPVLYTEVNINGTVNLLEECRKHNVKKFIFASSSSVYGNNKKVPFSEKDSVDHPISPYASTKKAGELICHSYHHLHQISLVCLRFFTVYGPRQRPDLAIHKFSRMMLSGDEIPVFGDGSTRRDYTYIEDILDGILKTINYVMSSTVFDVFNLGESQTISLSEMIKTIENELQIKAEKKILPLQPGDVDQTFADISKSRKILGYDPKTNFRDGIAKFIDWLKENQD
ncbi:MAG: epimerase [Candidatus Cloacimonadota bacterium]|nr:MAG: epimerase [Candidatus Cloacimonadota bacterium]RLC52822.1 MAG: epimerase [Candidatus Cloacimonadota bacterium]